MDLTYSLIRTLVAPPWLSWCQRHTSRHLICDAVCSFRAIALRCDTCVEGGLFGLFLLLLLGKRRLS